MPSREVVKRFIAVVESGRYVEAIAEFYADAATMQENLKPPRVGREALIAHETRALATVKEIRTHPVRTFLVDGDHVAINWEFEIHTKEGAIYGLNELALQRWEGDRIAEERFYYDPGQMPK